MKLNRYDAGLLHSWTNGISSLATPEYKNHIKTFSILWKKSFDIYLHWEIEKLDPKFWSKILVQFIFWRIILNDNFLKYCNHFYSKLCTFTVLPAFIEWSFSNTNTHAPDVVTSILMNFNMTPNKISLCLPMFSYLTFALKPPAPVPTLFVSQLIPNFFSGFPTQLQKAP